MNQCNRLFVHLLMSVAAQLISKPLHLHRSGCSRTPKLKTEASGLTLERPCHNVQLNMMVERPANNLDSSSAYGSSSHHQQILRWLALVTVHLPTHPLFCHCYEESDLLVLLSPFKAKRLKIFIM